MKKEREAVRIYWLEAIVAFFFILIVQWIFPRIIPFSTFEFWKINGGIQDWLKAGWPILAWGALINIIIVLCRIYKIKSGSLEEKMENFLARPDSEEVFLLFGILISTWAGIVEEISFRWLLFLGAIPGIKLANWLFFDWAGFGLAQWFQIHLFGPLNNFITLGALSDWLVNPQNWAVGAALLSTNAFFRDGHKYQGYFGAANSWFAGMFFFWIMFRYGLLAAILTHFCYDLVVTIVAYFGLKIIKKFL